MSGGCEAWPRWRRVAMAKPTGGGETSGDDDDDDVDVIDVDVGIDRSAPDS